MFKASQLALPLGERHTIFQSQVRYHKDSYGVLCCSWALSQSPDISYAPPTCPVLTPFPQVVFNAIYDAFFCFALSAFLRLLRIMTTERNEPTTVEPRMIRMTGMRMAQTRGRKKE